MATEKWIDCTVSCFSSVLTKEPVNRRLMTWLTSIYQPTTQAERERRDAVLRYRETMNPEIKKSLPAFCPGAMLKTRNSQVEDKIVHLTGLMQFDIDGKDNPHIDDFEKLRDEIFECQNVAFCSLSTSGIGVWGLIVVSDLTDYAGHFAQLQRDFGWMFNVSLDPSKGKNPTELRFYSFDPNAKLRKIPKLYDRKLANRKLTPVKNKIIGSSPSNETVIVMIREVNSRGIDIAPAYDMYVKCGFAIANEFGEDGRGLFHLLCEPHSNYDHQKTDKQFTECLRGNNGSITIGTLVYLLKNVLNHG